MPRVPFDAPRAAPYKAKAGRGRLRVTRFFFSFFGAIFTMVTLGLIMAALIVGGVFWVYGKDLPDVAALENYQPATLTRIYSPEGRIIDEYRNEKRIYMPIEEIPDLVKQAFISAEDKNFYNHNGVDLRGFAAVGVEAFRSRGQNLRGASTIPMQTAKILFFSGDRTIDRKIKEVIQAPRMVREIGRDKILEIYLNEIDLGFRAFGVVSAAQTYFNKDLTELTPEEAAYLAALPKAPYDYHPVRQEERAIQRRNFVLREMYENQYLDAEAFETARVAPLLTVQAGDRESFASQLPARDYFSAEISLQLDRQFRAEMGDGGFKSAGLTVRATVDPEMQKIAALALREALEKYDRAQGEWRGAAAVIAPEDLANRR